VGGWNRVSLEQKRSCRGMTGERPMVVCIAAARIIARWAPSPSSPAPAARRCAALGLDRSARPSKQAHHVVSHSELYTIPTGEN
jgi:hypothetical protein